VSSLKRAILIAASMAVFAGCRGGGGEPSPRSPAEAGLVALSERVDLAGAAVDPTAGDATVVIVFASWCGPCRHELTTLGDLRRDRPRVQIIGLNAYEDYEDYSDEERLRRFLAGAAPWLRVVRDDGTLLPRFGGVPKIPTLFIYDRGGRVVREFRRDQRPPPSASELGAAIDEAAERS
jgi:thiol-disulfide isomerase/thioredoxin